MQLIDDGDVNFSATVDSTNDDSDEEITSESETEEHKPEIPKSRVTAPKHKLSDMPEILAKRHKAYEQFRSAFLTACHLNEEHNLVFTFLVF